MSEFKHLFGGRALQHVFGGFEYFVLFYFSILVLFYTISGYFGLRAVIVYARGMSTTALKDLEERDLFKPISILMPAYNEAALIVHCVQSALDFDHSHFELLVVNDGSTDNTLDVLIEAFALEPIPIAFKREIETNEVRGVFRSLAYPNLTVIDKENGGKADAINATINCAKYPIVCVVDADSILDDEAVVRATRLFIEDETVVGVGGTLRPLNGATLTNGKITDLRAPDKWVERFQVLEYARSFFTSRAAWSYFNCLLNISGAFGLFRRETLIEVGGFAKGYVADDMEMILKIHRHYHDLKEPFKLLFTPDPVCWTQVPSTFKALCKQRDGWQRGLWEDLWLHKKMLFNPKYGVMGMLGLPYLWFFEAGAAFVEFFGYFYITVTLVMGRLNVPFAVMFMILAILYSVLLSQLAMGIETLLLARYSSVKDRFLLIAAAFVEFFGTRQIVAFIRAKAVFQIRSKHGKYWTEERQEIRVAPEVP